MSNRALEQLHESVRAKVCEHCPYRTPNTDGQPLEEPRPCESECPVFIALPVLHEVARRLEPLVSNRPHAIDSLIEHAATLNRHRGHILRKHATAIRDAVLEHFHD